MINLSKPVEGSGTLAAGIGVLALVAITLTACVRPGSQDKTQASEASLGAAVADMPPIDAEAPGTTETATFALG